MKPMELVQTIAEKIGTNEEERAKNDELRRTLTEALVENKSTMKSLLDLLRER